MYDRFCNAIKKLHEGQKGITGLETAIILIAFVTVASVLAYSVLSAGMFSAERGKAAVYSGLESVRNTLEVKGTVLGISGGQGNGFTSVIFNLGIAVKGDSIDLTQLVMNYWDCINVQTLTLDAVNSGDPTKATTTPGDWSYYLADGSAGSALTNDMLVFITVAMPANADAGSFNIDIIPPGGAAVNLRLGYFLPSKAVVIN